MKKAFGILFLIIGLCLIGLGIAAMTNTATRNESFEGQVGNEFSENYRSHNNEQQMAGLGLVGGGLIFFIIGIVMVATKTNAQRKKEVELAVLKRTQPADNLGQTAQVNDGSIINQLEQLSNLKEKGVLTAEEYELKATALKSELFKPKPKPEKINIVDLKSLNLAKERNEITQEEYLKLANKF